MTDILQTTALLEQARELKPLERSILRALRDKGPGLPLEVAVRVLKFPEEIGPALLDLKAKQLIRSVQFNGSALGDEMLSISPTGDQLLNVLDRLEQQAEFVQSTPVGKTTADSATIQQTAELQEAELLRKLGDVAAASGKTDEATTYYTQALKVIRQLRETSKS